MIRRIRVLEKSDSDNFLTHFTRSDEYRVGNQWFAGGNDWLHGYQVDEMKKPPIGTTFVVGDTVEVRNLNGELVETFEIAAIEMCDLDQHSFTNYSNSTDFRGSNPLFDVKRVWLIRKVSL